MDNKKCEECRKSGVTKICYLDGKSACENAKVENKLEENQ